MRNVIIGKKNHEAFTASLIDALILGLGLTDPHAAEAIANGKRFVVTTDLGDMEGQFYKGSAYTPERPRTFSMGWVHFRFRDADRAKASELYAGHDGRLNGYSGKWNWMFSSVMHDWEVPAMTKQIQRLNPTSVAIIG